MWLCGEQQFRLPPYVSPSRAFELLSADLPHKAMLQRERTPTVTRPDVLGAHPQQDQVGHQRHGHYRSRAGAEIAVLSFSHFPPAPSGQIYQGCVLHEGTWTSLGTIQPDVRGNAHLIAEGAEVAVPPEAVQVTLEPAGGSPVPSGPVVITWRSGSSGGLSGGMLHKPGA
jgi:hypothetical protein